MGENQTQSTFTIGQLAGRYSLNVRTIRYYESIGLLSPVGRTTGGYRLYGEAQEKLLRFVLQAKRVGFSLEEIQNIVQLGKNGSACDYVRKTVAEHISAIDKQITELQDLRAQLARAEKAWQKMSAVTDGEICGLIEGLSDSPENKTGAKNNG